VDATGVIFIANNVPWPVEAVHVREIIRRLRVLDEGRFGAATAAAARLELHLAGEQGAATFIDFTRNEKAALREAVGGWVDEDGAKSPRSVQSLRYALHVEARG
jgi:hypothetical protein